MESPVEETKYTTCLSAYATNMGRPRQITGEEHSQVFVAVNSLPSSRRGFSGSVGDFLRDRIMYLHFNE